MGDYYNTLYRLWSVMAFGAGTKLLADASEGHSSAEDMYIALTNCEGPSDAVKAAKDIPLKSAERLLDICIKSGINIVTCDDEDFPAGLKVLPDRPALLFYRGDISGLGKNLSIAVVGARKPSDYSRRVAAGIVSTLSRDGFDIVSGFAEGIDICAHITAIKQGAKTYAVLGCGIDVIYPKPNEKYKQYIIENGALISEYLPATSPMPVNFPHRNRIIAALSLGAAVIEAGAKSGSLNTASHCSEQGKPVFAVPPHDLYDSRYRGNVEIIRQGAVPLMSAKDIYSEYCLNIPHTIVENEELCKKLEALKARNSAAPEQSESAGTKPVKTRKPALSIPDSKAAEKPAEKPAKPIPEGDSREEKALLEALAGSDRPLRADELAEICEMEIGSVLTALTGMEIEGTVTTENGSVSLQPTR